MATFVERLKFRDVFAIGGFGSLVAALVYAPIDDIVKGAFIAAVTLIVQFYFRKKDEPVK